MGSVILFISGSEIVVIMLVVLILFGSKSIPGMARTFGKGMKEFRNVTQEIKNELENSTEDFRKDIDDVKNTVQKETKKISDDVKNVSDNVTKKTMEMTDEVDKGINTTSEKKQKTGNSISDETDVKNKTSDENKSESVYGYDLEEPETEIEAAAEEEESVAATTNKNVESSDPKKNTKISQNISKEKVEQEDGSDND